MGYRGMIEEQNLARELRAQAWTLAEIAHELQVNKSSVSEWVRGVEFDEQERRRRELERKASGTAAARQRGPNALQRRKQAEIQELNEAGRARIGTMSEREFLVAGVALYAGEGAKRDGSVRFANTDPRMIAFFCTWLRRFFEVDESRLRLRLYLHQGLDITAANEFWSDLTGIPLSQFGKPYRAVSNPAIRKAKHIFGCPSVVYSCSRTHRTVTGLMGALLSSDSLPG
jgi:predicted transcriptional regulator